MKNCYDFISEKLKINKNSQLANKQYKNLNEFSTQHDCYINRYNRSSEVELCVLSFKSTSHIFDTIIFNLNKMIKQPSKTEKCLDYLNNTYKLDENIVCYFHEINNNTIPINTFTIEDNSKNTLSKLSLRMEFRESEFNIDIRMLRKPRIDIESIAIGLLNYLLNEKI